MPRLGIVQQMPILSRTPVLMEVTSMRTRCCLQAGVHGLPASLRRSGWGAFTTTRGRSEQKHQDATKLSVANVSSWPGPPARPRARQRPFGATAPGGFRARPRSTASDLGLFRDLEGVIDLDPEVPHGRFKSMDCSP